MSRKAPGIRQRFMLPYGYAAEARRDDLSFYSKLEKQYGGIVRWDIGPITLHLVTKPEYIQHVLVDRYEIYPRSRFSNALLNFATGDGLVTADGEPWKRQRKMVQPAFTKKRISALVPLINQSVERILDGWQAESESGDTIDFGREMMRLTLLVVGRALFSKDISGKTDKFGSAFGDVMKYIEFKRKNPISAPIWIPTRHNRRYKAAERIINGIVYGMIADRRETTPETSSSQRDLLDMLLLARNEETGEPMAEKQVRDETLTFLIAGHETTATALMWTMYCLSRHPEVNRRVQDEVDSVLGDRKPTIEDVGKLAYTRAVLDESMRIYPPVWALGRDASERCEIDGYEIPKKSVILLSPYVTHRSENVWQDADVFNPERFMSIDHDRFAYYPFGGGPHVCIGMEFAILEAMLTISQITQKYELQAAHDGPLVPEPSFTLRPKGGLEMSIRKRTPATST